MNPLSFMFMGIRKMEQMIFDIMVDNGISPKDAQEILRGMSSSEMEEYLTMNFC